MIQAIAKVSCVKTLIYASSVAVYSNCIEAGGDTYEKPRPVDAYGKDKLMCEREALGQFSVRGRQAIVIRLGHVYGAFQVWSANILNLSRDARFRLPFGGCLLSNAVSIGRVCHAIAGLLAGPPEAGIYNLTDAPQRTWGDVFAWHTGACGLARIGALDDDESLRIKGVFLDAKRRSFVKYCKDFSHAVRTAAIQLANSNPLLKDLGSALVARFPGVVQGAIVRKYKRALVQQINVGQRNNLVWEPWLGWLFSDPVPGPHLCVPATVLISADTEQTMRSELSRWFTRWSMPDGIWRN